VITPKSLPVLGDRQRRASRLCDLVGNRLDLASDRGAVLFLTSAISRPRRPCGSGAIDVDTLIRV